MSNPLHTWDLPDYSTPLPGRSSSDLTATARSRRGPDTRRRGQSGRKVGTTVRSRVRAKVSTRFTVWLMLVTSAIALVDLYLLGTAIPH